MNPRRLTRAEAIAAVGGLLLAASLFFDWYHAKTVQTHLVGSLGPVSKSGWDVHPVLRFLLLAAASAPLILAWIVARGHALSWPRGELTAIVAIAAFGLVAYNALIAKPGDPSSQVELKYGVYLAMAGTVLMLVGAAQRSGETERARKPPGTI